MIRNSNTCPSRTSRDNQLAAASDGVGIREAEGRGEFMLAPSSGLSTVISGTEQTAKRAADVVLGLALVVVCLPVFALVMVAARILGSRGVINCSERLGTNGHVLRLYRLQTPSVSSSSGSIMISLFRRLHFDEIPKLINIVKGDVSFFEMRKAKMLSLRGTVKTSLTR
jgi:lipopolysaccharide/colanic/teichoic acid biosynthesis glycosyltransferase